MSVAAPSERFPIAYLAGMFPLRSETFVYREVRELRRRGWPVSVFSLHPSPDIGSPELADLSEGVTPLYGQGLTATVAASVVEELSHPWRAAGTRMRSVVDAMWPGDPTPIKARLRLPFQAIAALDLARKLRKQGIRHLHCHFAHAPATVGMYAARQAGISWSFTGHANDIFQRRALLRTKLRRADFVGCISEWHRRFYAEIEPSAIDRLKIIRCGAPTDLWTCVPPGAESDVLRVLVVCRLVEKKGVDTLIEAIADLQQRLGIAARLVVAGDGPDAMRLHHRAEELGCTDAITWLGAVNNSRVRELLGQTDVFALPCRLDRTGDRDGIPVALIEAMSCGVAVVAGDLPAIRELVADEVSGLLTPSGDARALADRLARLRADPNLRRALGAGGRSRVESEFSLDQNVSRLEEAIAIAANRCMDAQTAEKQGPERRGEEP